MVEVPSPQIVTERYLCDINLQTPSPIADFDYTSKKVMNYRINLTVGEIKSANSVERYEIATVHLIHDLAGAGGLQPTNFASMLTYAGKQRAEWLQEVLSALPVRLLLA